METIANLKHEVRLGYCVPAERYIKCSDPGFLSAHRQHASLEVCELLLTLISGDSDLPIDSPQMSVLSRQVTAVSQELQEVTRLLRPLFHSASALLLPSAVTPPPSVSSHSCSPAPPPFTRHAPVDCSDNPNPPSFLVPDASSLLSAGNMLRGEFDPLKGPASQNSPLTSHWSAPSSLNSSPHEHTVVPHSCSSSSSIPSLSSASHPSSVAPASVDLSRAGPRNHPPSLSQSLSQLQLQPVRMSKTHDHSHSHPLLQPSSMSPQAQEPLQNLAEAAEWRRSPAQLSFIDEGQRSV